MIETLDLVMACFRNRPHGTAGDALSAKSLSEKKTVCMMVIIGSGAWRDPDESYYRACSHSFPPFRYQAVA